MKTTNNVQKTANRNASVLKSLVLLTVMAGFSLMAGAHENARNQAVEEGNELLLASIARITVTMDTRMEVASETALEVENWMISEDLFTSPVPVSEAFTEVESENALELESWMVSETYFATPLPVAESEEALPVEQWMLEDQNFSKSAPVQESDQALEVESWMLNPGTWGC